MPITQAEELQLVEGLRRDLTRWGHGRHLHRVDAALVRARAMADGRLDLFAEELVGEVQQDLMDLFIDTTWPRCPRHYRHPLWFHDGGWFCDQDQVKVASLGDLPAPPPEESPWRLKSSAA